MGQVGPQNCCHWCILATRENTLNKELNKPLFGAMREVRKAVMIFMFGLLVITFLLAQVSQSGWSEGECKGKAGWFPSAYVEKRQRIPSTADVATEVY